MQQAEHRYRGAEMGVQLEGLAVPVVHALADAGRYAHHRLQQEFDDHAGGETGVQRPGYGIVLACHRAPPAPAMNRSTRRSNSSGWSKNSAWAACSTATNFP